MYLLKLMRSDNGETSFKASTKRYNKDELIIDSYTWIWYKVIECNIF